MTKILLLKSTVRGHFRTLSTGKRPYIGEHQRRDGAQMALFPKPASPPSKPMPPDAVKNPQKYTPDLFTGETQAEREARGDLPTHVHGIPVKIENPKGSIRSKTPRTPGAKPWQMTMQHHYGDLVHPARGKDGDPIDVYVGDHPDADRVHVVNQNDREGNLNEHKVMAHFPSAEAARAGYMAHYPAGWTGLGSMTSMSVPDFHAWMDHGDKNKAAAVPPLHQAAPFMVRKQATAA